MGRKKVRKFWIFKYSLYIDRDGYKCRRLFVTNHFWIGINDREKAHGPGKPERGKHIHVGFRGKELVVYLDGKRPITALRDSSAWRRRQEKRRRREAKR